MWRKFIVATACLAALGAPPGVRAADPSAAGGGGEQPAAVVTPEGDRDVADATFVRKAAAGNQAEVELAELAIRKASDASVKQFAERIKKDHSAAQQKLEQAARSAGVEMPATLDDAHDSDLTRLEKLDGAEFDEAYMTLMVQEHAKDLQAYNDQVRESDGAIAAYARETVPVLESHVELARTVSRNREDEAEERQGSMAPEAILTGGTAE